MKLAVFLINLLCHSAYLSGIIYSIGRPDTRIWPPPGKSTWQYKLYWNLLYTLLTLNIVLMIADWDSGPLPDLIRFYLGIPLLLSGILLLSWAVHSLGISNTYGLVDRLVIFGPYHYSRNPQYLSCFLILIAVAIIANSTMIIVLHALLIFLFILATLPEEDWLEQEYGDAYIRYKLVTPRFL